MQIFNFARIPNFTQNFGRGVLEEHNSDLVIMMCSLISILAVFYSSVYW